MENQEPFADVIVSRDGFSLPELKWRELLFIGALRPDGDAFIRDAGRPLPPFHIPDLIPQGARFAVRRDGKRVQLKRL